MTQGCTVRSCCGAATVLTVDAHPPGAARTPTSSSPATGSPRSGPNLAVPEGTREIDASGGIVMPGMIDTHRHMWQTAMRGYGADWTLTQYFVWYYLESGRHFRPEDVHAGNLLAALEAVDAGVTTCVDWSHGLQTTEPRRRRRRRAAARCPAGSCSPTATSSRRPWEWSTSAGVPRLRPPPHRRGRRPARLPDGVRRHRRPGVPGAGRLRGGARAGRPGHHPRRGVGRDQRRRHPARCTRPAS